MIWKAPEFKVGLFVLVVFVFVGFLSVKISNKPSSLLGQSSYWFELEDSTGLVVNSVVRMAGVKVGTVEKISLIKEKGIARVDFSLDSKIQITSSSGVHILSQGILGDKQIQIMMGDISDPVLDPGSQLRVFSSGSSINLFIDKVGSSVEALSKTIRMFEEAIGPGSHKTALGRMFQNLEQATKTLSDVATQNETKLSEIINNFVEVSEGLGNILNEESGKEFKGEYKKLVRGFSDISETLANLQEITQKINSGEGTIGKLVNDETVLDQVNSLVARMNTMISDFSNFETVLDTNALYGINEKSLTQELNMHFRPGLDRAYEVGLVYNKDGVSSVTETDIESTSGNENKIETVYYRNKLKYRILYGRKYYNFFIKGGIIENKGGLGIDYSLLKDRLKFSAEFYDFGNLKFRYFFRYHMIPILYFTGGAYVYEGSKLKDSYIGLGLSINNDDLKLLATKASF